MVRLWISDGTAADTRLLADLAPGPNGRLPAELVVSGKFGPHSDRKLFFVASTTATGNELYVIERLEPPVCLDLNPGQPGARLVVTARAA